MLGSSYPNRRSRGRAPPGTGNGPESVLPNVWHSPRLAPDVQGLLLESIDLPDTVGEKGSYPAWRAVFISPSKMQAKTITYSIKEAYGNLHKGIFKGPDEGWSPGGEAKPWVLSAFKIDSDAAYRVALGKSADYVRDNPDVPIRMLLEWTDRRPNLVWRVYWGQSLATSGYSVFVDASTGEFAGRTG